MKLLISLSVRTSPLEEQKTIFENAKDNVKKATRNEKLARDNLAEAAKKSSGVASATKQLKLKSVVRRRLVDVQRIQQQKVGRAGVVDRLVREWNKLEELKGTDQDTDTTKARRVEVAKLINVARDNLRKLKLPKSTIKRKKYRR